MACATANLVVAACLDVQSIEDDSSQFSVEINKQDDGQPWDLTVYDTLTLEIRDARHPNNLKLRLTLDDGLAVSTNVLTITLTPDDMAFGASQNTHKVRGTTPAGGADTILAGSWSHAPRE